MGVIFAEDQAPASSVFLLQVEFESSRSKKSKYRVAVATVNNVILDVISSVISPSLCQDWAGM